MNTRARIVSLAIVQLKKGGYSELSFGEIASELGVSRANIHHHFSNKANLAKVALTKYIEDDLAQLQALIDEYPNDFPKVLRAIDKHFEELYLEYPVEGICACCTLLLNTADVPSELKALAKNYFERLCALFESGIRRSQEAGTISKSVRAADLAWECVMLGIAIIGLGTVVTDDFVHHPVRGFFRAKAEELS